MLSFTVRKSRTNGVSFISKNTDDTDLKLELTSKKQMGREYAICRQTSKGPQKGTIFLLIGEFSDDSVDEAALYEVKKVFDNTVILENQIYGKDRGFFPIKDPAARITSVTGKSELEILGMKLPINLKAPQEIIAEINGTPITFVIGADQELIDIKVPKMFY